MNPAENKLREAILNRKTPHASISIINSKRKHIHLRFLPLIAFRFFIIPSISTAISALDHHPRPLPTQNFRLKGIMFCDTSFSHTCTREKSKNVTRADEKPVNSPITCSSTWHCRRGIGKECHSDQKSHMQQLA